MGVAVMEASQQTKKEMSMEFFEKLPELISEWEKIEAPKKNVKPSLRKAVAENWEKLYQLSQKLGYEKLAELMSGEGYSAEPGTLKQYILEFKPKKERRKYKKQAGTIQIQSRKSQPELQVEPQPERQVEPQPERQVEPQPEPQPEPQLELQSESQQKKSAIPDRKSRPQTAY